MGIVFSLLRQITIISSVLILVVLVIEKLLSKRLSLKIMLFLWLIVLIRLIIPSFVNSPIDLYKLIPEATLEQITEVIDNTQINQIFDYKIQPANSADTTIFDNYNNSGTNINAIYQIIEYFKNIHLFIYAIFIWCLGVVLVASKKIYAGYKFSKIIADDKEIELTEAIEECRRRLKYNKKITIKKSRYVTAPITYGIVNPTILLPENLIENISQRKLLLILMHEISHIKRKDIFKNYIWLAAKTLHWFNPLVYIAYKQYLINVELTCDQMVIDNISADERFEYSQTLLDVIKMSSSHSVAKAPSGVSFCENNTKIRKRVEKMLNSKKQIKSAGIITVVFAFVLMFCCFTTACFPIKDNTAAKEAVSEEPVLNTEDQLADDIYIYDGENTKYYTVTLDDEFKILDKYDTDDNSCIIISGSKNEKEATEIAKKAISYDDNISYGDLTLKEIDDISSDETTFQVVLESGNNELYTVVVKVSTGEIESISSEPKN